MATTGPARLLASDYILDGLITCDWCRRQMRPMRNLDGHRAYCCDPQCPRPAVAALPIEQDALIKALVRAYVVLRQVGRPTETALRGVNELDVSPAERMRWTRCDLSDRRALLRTAFSQVMVDERGRLRLVWPHEADAETQSGAPTV